MERNKKFVKGLKICCSITLLLLIIVLVTAVVLFLTILKPKQPKITTQEVNLEYIKFFPLPFLLNVTLGITVTIDNPNYGSFKYGNSTAYVTYHGDLVAEAPIEADEIPARGRRDISTTVEVIGDRLVSNRYFWVDHGAGSFNFSSSSTLHGKAKVLKFLKMKVTTHNTCDITVFFLSQNVSSVCKYRVQY
ncbi:uncharacterized protein LOC130782243 [Actinidia eriantha]|uniref:uncharacterized protein LOC130782243 n=1 Tax=Actinidia eriantha TaxID=165200 RepID=UPI002590ACD2|nr:uncharacterized protein LOC130782243 [Actinidia eriantha]